MVSAAELMRVDVGKTAWLFLQNTPRPAIRCKNGVFSAVMASGLSPSHTISRVMLALLSGRHLKPALEKISAGIG